MSRAKITIQMFVKKSDTMSRAKRDSTKLDSSKKDDC